MQPDRSLGLLLVLAAMALLVGAAPAQEQKAWVKVYHADAPALGDALEKAGFDVVRHAHGPLRNSVEVIVTPPELYALTRRGLAVEILVGFGVDAPPDARYKTDVEVMQILQGHAKNYPNIARFADLNQELGLPRTVENRSLYGLKISDNPLADEDEEAVLIYACEHARELLCIEVVLYAIDELLKGYTTDPQIKAWIDTKEIWFVPNLNPDGLAYVWSTDNMWRKNRRPFGSDYGVDINRNAGMGWSSSCSGSTLPRSSTYKGPAPFSEIETQVLRDLHKREHFAKVCSNHNSGREVLYPLLCSTGGVPAVLYSYLQGIDVTMAKTISYANRNPSAEGECYQWCFQWNGAFSMLIESGTAFQPAWSAVDPEVKRVWPGIKWLLDFKTPLSGHVTNRYTGGPIRADIAVQGLNYGNGETRFSDPTYGRYHYYLPDGSYNLTFTADGYRAKQVNNVQVNAAGAVLDVQMEPSATITITGTPSIGNTLKLELSDPGMANKTYAMHAALTTKPPIDLGHGDLLPLGPDFLFFVSPFLPNIFQNYYGTLNGQAQSTAQAVLPAVPAFVGLTIHQAFASIDPSAPNSIGHVSGPASFTIVK